MFDYGYWILFFSASFALSISPGPDVIYILTKTISGGKKVGFASSFGVCTGALFHVLLASIGLSAILVSSELAFTFIKYIGATYLIYLAYKSFKSAGTSLHIEHSKKTKESPWKAFKQGMLIDILNPKVAIFFMAFLPQFVREGYGSVSIQLFYLGFLVICVGIVVESIYVLLASKLTHKIRNSKKISIWLDKIVGTIFIGLGLKLAISTNR